MLSSILSLLLAAPALLPTVSPALTIHGMQEPQRPRAGSIRGSVLDVSGQQHYSMSVVCAPRGEPLVQVGGEGELQLGGLFEFSQLKPGAYTLAIHRWDQSWHEGRRAVKHPLPLLGYGVDLRNTVDVVVVPGEVAKVDLEPAPLGTITGLVTHAGVPTPGVRVWSSKAKTPRAMGYGVSGPDFELDTSAHTVTDAEGRYRFLYQKPGTWKLHFMHAEQKALAEPVKVTAAAHAENIVRSHALGTATIRGQLAKGFTEGVDTAYLFRASDAAVNPFYWVRHVLPITSGMRVTKIGADGKFRLTHVPAGAWVLRIAPSWEQSRLQPAQNFWQEYFDVRKGQVINLGEVRRHEQIALALHLELPPKKPLPKGSPAWVKSSQGLWIRRLAGIAEHRIWRQTVMVEAASLVQCNLRPGRYEAELFDSMSGPAGPRRTTSGKHARFVISADGTSEPKLIRFE